MPSVLVCLVETIRPVVIDVVLIRKDFWQIKILRKQLVS